MRLVESKETREISSNASWLIFSRIFRIALGILVVTLTARYLGPLQYGSLSFAVSFAALFGLLTRLGLRNIVVRELVEKPHQINEVLGSSFYLISGAGVAASLAGIVSISLLRPGDHMSLLLVALCTSSHIFAAFEVIDYYFQSRVRSRFTVIARSSAFLFFSFVKIGLVLFRAPLPLFAIAIIGEILFESIACVIVYKMRVSPLRIWTFDKKIAVSLFTASLPLLLSSIAIFGYTRIDQIMIGQFLGDNEVGIYSIAVRFSTAWFFVPTAIANSLFPALLKAQKRDHSLYTSILQKLSDIMVFLSFLAAVLVTILAKPMTVLLFGEAYQQSADILVLHVWCGIFVSIGIASQHWFIAENLQRYTLYRTLAGCVVNIGLNIAVIPIFGLKGAAITTIVSQGVASYLFNGVNAKTRQIFAIQSKALFIPRLPLALISYVRTAITQK